MISVLWHSYLGLLLLAMEYLFGNAFGHTQLHSMETDGWQWLVLFDETITKTVTHGLHERLIQWLKKGV